VRKPEHIAHIPGQVAEKARQFRNRFNGFEYHVYGTKLSLEVFRRPSLRENKLALGIIIAWGSITFINFKVKQRKEDKQKDNKKKQESGGGETPASELGASLEVVEHNEVVKTPKPPEAELKRGQELESEVVVEIDEEFGILKKAGLYFLPIFYDKKTRQLIAGAFVAAVTMIRLRRSSKSDGSEDPTD